MTRYTLAVGLTLSILLAACGTPTPVPPITVRPPDQLPTATPIALGTIYYVSASGGNDDNPGTSPDQPWQTLAKVSSMTFQPHDQILLKRGDVWDGEELVLQGSGDFMDDS